MLESVDSHELAEWRAFEQEFGVVGDGWRDQMLCEIHHAIEVGNHYFLQANSEDDDSETPKRFPMSWEIRELMMKEAEQDG